MKKSLISRIFNFKHTMGSSGTIDEKSKTHMLVASMEALLETRNPEEIFHKICNYSREISESHFALIAFFKHNNQTYEVQSFSSTDHDTGIALAEQLQLSLKREYEISNVAAFKRLIEEKWNHAYRSISHFFKEKAAPRQTGPAEMLPNITQIDCYPITLGREISGAIVLFRDHHRKSTDYFHFFAIQCSLVLQFASQIKELEDKRRIEEQLHQAQKMEAIGQLAGGVAHDFNNMLSGITGYANLIKRKYASDKPELRTFADSIVSAAMRASDLTSKLLAYARKGKYQTVTIDLHSAVQEVISLLEHTLDKRIRISERFQASPSGINGDPTQIQNMLLNLALNARDAMPGGGDLVFKTETIVLNAGLSMDGRYEISAGTYLVLSVIDTGIGMDENTRKRLFEPFFTTKEIGKGTGLGLASVYGTVKSHGGFIVVESEPDHGSTFRIYLPLTKNPPKKTTSPDTEYVVRGHGSIMVVDDEEMIRSLTKEILTFLGYSVITCKDGPEAIAHFSTNAESIDLVILDIIMPKMDGHETFRELSRIKPDVKVILMTGYSIKEDTRQIINRGVDGFIQKPFESGVLSQLVHDVISKKKDKPL